MTNILVGDDQKQQILALGRLGWPLRRIEQATGVQRETDLTSPRAGVRMDLTRTPWRDASFDAILCNPLLEHIPTTGKP
jgi:hypothetical protein